MVGGMVVRANLVYILVKHMEFSKVIQNTGKTSKKPKIGRFNHKEISLLCDKKWNGKARKGIEPLKKPADLIYQILSHHSPYLFSEYYLAVIHLDKTTKI